MSKCRCGQPKEVTHACIDYVPAEPKCADCGDDERCPIPPHKCNGVDGAARHGYANACTVCGRFSTEQHPGCESYRPAEPASEGELKPCPLCHEPKDLQIEQLPGYKPEIVCNNCGIALQGEDVLDAITRWNKRTKEQANAK